MYLCAMTSAHDEQRDSLLNRIWAGFGAHENERLTRLGHVFDEQLDAWTFHGRVMVPNDAEL